MADQRILLWVVETEQEKFLVGQIVDLAHDRETTSDHMMDARSWCAEAAAKAFIKADMAPKQLRDILFAIETETPFTILLDGRQTFCGDI